MAEDRSPRGRTIPFVASTSDNHIRQRWQDAMKTCEKELGKEDFAYIMQYDSAEQLLKGIDSQITKIRDGSISRLLRQMKPYVDQVQTFVLGVVVMVNWTTGFKSVCIWGLINLMLRLAGGSEDFLSSITDMWADIAHSLQVFDTYKDHLNDDPALGLILFEILEELQKFAVHTIKNLKFAGSLNYGTRLARCKSHFEVTSRNISNRIQIFKDKMVAERLSAGQRADAINLLRRDQEHKGQNIENGSAEEARLPCFYVPFPANNLFHARQNILHDIQDRLAGSNPQIDVIPSVALWGTAGIGKTQIALEYAYKKRKDGVQAIFWIDAEHESEYSKAFTEIADVLNLQGATSSKGHDTNRLLVLRWLQETRVPWIIIFDNVEDQRVLNTMWPSHGHGSIVVTCRSELTAASSPSAYTIQVPPFNSAEGSVLLLKEIGHEPETDSNKQLASEFSDLLGGHALSLDVMARSIVARKKGLRNFVNLYKKNPRNLHKRPRRNISQIQNRYYKSDDDIESLWAIPFSEQDEQTSRTLGIMSICGPNQIPVKIFQTAAYGVEEDEFDEITLYLRGQAMIETNENSTTFSVHRLIQYEYRNYIGIDEEAARWRDAMVMIREVFPRQRKGFTMFNQWKLCESLIEHVEAIASTYHSLAERVALDYSEDFTYLLADAARYLTEIGRYNASVSLLNHGFHHCTDRQCIAYTNLCVTMGHVLCERGQDMAALKYNDIVLSVRQLQLDEMHSEIANALSNSALSMVGCGQDVETALAMLERSLEIDLSNPPEDYKKVLHLRHYNMAFALRALGRTDEAWNHVSRASALAQDEFGNNSRYLTISYRMYADFAMREQRYDEAYEHALRSLEIAQLESSVTPWAAAALFYLGSIILSQGKAKQAIHYLTRARTICEMNEREKTDKGESARVMNKLAQAYEESGDASQAQKMREEAESIYRNLVMTGEYTTSDDERLKWDYLISLKFR